jgi:Dienelactone hydrolase family
MTDINTQWHTLETADGPMRLYAAYPEQPATRAVVVLQEAFGVNGHIQDVTRRFAERGFLAVAPDLFHRNGIAELRYDQHAEAMPLIGAIGPDAIITDISAMLQKLAAEGSAPARIAIIGFCFGGRAAFHRRHSRPRPRRGRRLLRSGHRGRPARRPRPRGLHHRSAAAPRRFAGPHDSRRAGRGNRLRATRIRSRVRPARL